MKAKHRIVSSMIVILVISMIQNAGAVEIPRTKCYTYSTASGDIEALYCPMPFMPSKVIKFADYGDQIQSPIDLCFTKEKKMLVLDQYTGNVIEFDKEFQIVSILGDFTYNNQTDHLSSPNGIFISEDDLIYICDTGNQRVVIFDQDFHVIDIIESPASDILGTDYEFQPMKIAVDVSGNMYIINKNEFQGLMQIDAEGKFVSFIGSNRVVYNPIDAFWKSIMTDIQREQLVDFIPIEYTNVSLDHEHFLYTVSSAKNEEVPIKRLNLTGTDILRRNGYVDVSGDVGLIGETKNTFVDITSNKSGEYFALDSTFGKIFAYNQDGYLLYAFGGIGNNEGQFQSPNAIESFEDHLYVIDYTNVSLTVFDKTMFAKTIESADLSYRKGQYDQSEKYWQEVTQYNSNYELAYAQLGSISLQRENYKEAMHYFALGNYRGSHFTLLDGYNKSFIEFRKDFLHNYLAAILIGLVAATILLFVARSAYKKHQRRRVQKNSDRKG